VNPKLIVIDGKTYHSIDEMPPDIRQKYEQAMRSLGDANDNHIPDAFETMNIFADKNKNGVPDVMDNLVAGNAAVNSMKIVVDGKEFNGLENLPPEYRARYQEAMSQLDANRNGIPDFVEGMMNTTNQTTNIATNLGAQMPRHAAPLPVNPTITSESTNIRGIMLAGLFVFLLCAVGAAGVWYFFLR
jgi:hypothetical protein